MAFSTPATETAGLPLTAGYLNTYVRDNIAWLATDSPCCRAYNNAVESTATGTLSAMTLNSERYDNAAMHSTSSNTSRIVAPAGGGGKYLVGGAIEFSSASGAGNVRALYLRHNATTNVAIQSIPPLGGGGTPALTVLAVYALSAADYVEMYSYQDSGGVLNINSSGNYSPELYAVWLRT